jgi:predicted component of type VI protein secretion system
MDRNCILKVMDGALQGQSFKVTSDGLMVGRGEHCAVRLPEPGVSREHARVFLHNAGVWVQDMGSRNGVFVKGNRIMRPKQVSPGTEFTVGDHRFTIAMAEGVAADHAPEPAVRSNAGKAEFSFSEPTVSMSAPAAPRSRMPIAVAALLVLGLIAAWLFAG